MSPYPAAVDSIVVKMIQAGRTEAIASTQYNMGLILSDQNEIMFRNDGISHEERKEIAREVNEILKKNQEKKP